MSRMSDDPGLYEAEMKLSRTSHLSIGIFLTVSGIIGMIANCSIIASFLLNKNRLSPVSVVLVNLTLSDLGILIMGFPFNAISHLKGRWVYGWFACQIYGYCCFLFGTAHIGALSLLAYEQFRTISRMRPDAVPTQGYLMRLQRNYIFYSVLIWMFAVIWATPPLFGWSRYHLEPFGTACTIDWRDETFEFKSYIIAYFIGGYILPFGVMLYSFRKIVVLKKQYQRNTVRMNNHDSIIETLKRHREEDLTLTCILTVITFLVTWTPYAILCLWSVFLGPRSVPPALAIWPNICAKASGSVNPFVITMSNRRLRARVRDTIHLMFMNRTSRPSGGNTESTIVLQDIVRQQAQL